MQGIQGFWSAVSPLEVDCVPSFPLSIGSARKDELSLVVEVLDSTGRVADPSSNFVSFLAIGDGSTAFESNLADSLFFLASSTGPKTLDLNRDLFAFFTLDRKLLAIGNGAL